jgi:hypothetical protein
MHIHLHLVPKLGMNGAVPLLPLQVLVKCKRANLTFTNYLPEIIENSAVTELRQCVPEYFHIFDLLRYPIS